MRTERTRHLSIHFTSAIYPERMRRDRHCGHVWCLSTRLWREVKVTARLVPVYRYFGKLVLVPFRYFSIDIFQNIDIFDNISVRGTGVITALFSLLREETVTS